MLHSKDTWDDHPEARQIHSIWQKAIVQMGICALDLKLHGHPRQSMQMSGYCGSVTQAAMRHLDQIVSAENGHAKSSDSGVSAAKPTMQALAEPVNGHGTSAEVTVCAANEEGATCAVPGLPADSHLTADQGRDTALPIIRRVELRIEELRQQEWFRARDPQAFEVAMKFMQAALAFALHGQDDLATKKLAAAENVLKGGLPDE